ncbi:MAG TPA: hypothetical protein VEC06_19205 [Paucimonas sp.]|nr:hypothetical protein [Paucimonas sp.]
MRSSTAFGTVAFATAAVEGIVKGYRIETSTVASHRGTAAVIHRLHLLLVSPFAVLRRGIHALWAMQNRERERLYGEMQQVRGLIHLLMKQRNGYRWTELERRKIRAQLRQLAEMSPYLILFVSPGGFLALPLLVWWLDRRRQKRDAGQAAAPTLAASNKPSAAPADSAQE